MNKIYDFQEFLNENREVPEDLMHQVKKHFNINGKLWLDSEGRVCCDGDVELKDKTIQRFPFQWGEVWGDFDCSFCMRLISLKGAPREVKKSFSCYRCPKLTSLEEAPVKVGGQFSCANCNQLTSLKGAPQKVNRSFICYSCTSLTSLEGAPQEVGKIFDCDFCLNLVSLKGAPQRVDEYFSCRYNSKLTSLRGAPLEADRYHFDECTKVPEEELALAKHPELLKSWLKSGLELEDWKKEKRGLVASKKFGF